MVSHDDRDILEKMFKQEILPYRTRMKESFTVSMDVTYICVNCKNWVNALFISDDSIYPPGLSPDLQSMEQIRRIMRPTDVPDQGLLCDLLWSDPDKETMGWGENDRGVSFTFGSEVVAKFLHKHDLDLICRAHQVIVLLFLHLYKTR